MGKIPTKEKQKEERAYSLKEGKVSVWAFKWYSVLSPSLPMALGFAH